MRTSKPNIVYSGVELCVTQLDYLWRYNLVGSFNHVACDIAC